MSHVLFPAPKRRSSLGVDRYMHKFKRSVIFRSTVLILLALMSPSFLNAQCVTAPSGMVDWWPADNNTFDIVGGHNGTLENGSTFDTGKVAQAFSLDGVDDHVLVPNDPAAAFNFSGSFSIDAWVFLNAAPAPCQRGFAPIVAKWNDEGF